MCVKQHRRFGSPAFVPDEDLEVEDKLWVRKALHGLETKEEVAQ